MKQYSRKKGTLALIFSSYASIILSVIKGIVLFPIYLHFINDRLFGAWLATGGIVAYFGLLDFGLNGVLIQKVSSLFGKNDNDKLGSILGTGIVIGLLFSLIPTILGLFIVNWVPGIVHVAGVDAEKLGTAFILASVGASSMLAMYTIGGIVVSFQRQIVHGIMLVIGDIVGVFVIIWFLYKGYGLIAIPLGTIAWSIFAILGEGIYLYWFFKNKMPLLRVKVKKDVIKELAVPSIWQFGYRSTNTISKQSDNLLIAAIIDPYLCTIYTFTNKASEVLSMFAKHFVGAFLPSFSHLNGEGNDEKFRNITLQLLKLTVLFGICLLGCYLFLNKYFISIWVGDKYYGGTILTILFFINSLFVILTSFFYCIIFAKDEIVISSKAYIAESVIRIPLSIAFLLLFGMKGAVISAIIAMIPTSLFIQGKKFIEKLKITKVEIYDVLKIIVTQIVFILVAGIILTHFWTPEGIVNFALFGLAYITLVIGLGVFVNKKLFISTYSYYKNGF